MKSMIGDTRDADRKSKAVYVRDVIESVVDHRWRLVSEIVRRANVCESSAKYHLSQMVSEGVLQKDIVDAGAKYVMYRRVEGV